MVSLMSLMSSIMSGSVHNILSYNHQFWNEMKFVSVSDLKLDRLPLWGRVVLHEETPLPTHAGGAPPVAVPVTHSPHSKSWVRACIILPKECFLKCVADLIGNYDVEMPNPGNKSESESKLSLNAVLTISLLAALVLSLIFSGILIQCHKKSATKKGRNLMAWGKCTLMSAN